MKNKLRFVAVGLIFAAMMAIMVAGKFGNAIAGTSSGATAVPVGSTTPVVLVNQGEKNYLQVCNTGTTNALYCLLGTTGTVTTTNWDFIVPAASSTAATLGNSGCWTSNQLQKPVKINQSVAIEDKVTCLSNSSTTARAYWR
jgi:hypothetical protein